VSNSAWSGWGSGDGARCAYTHSVLSFRVVSYWEAVNLHYWATNDYEWYDPDSAITKAGNLEIVLTEQPNHDLNFRSAMIQGW